MGVSGWDREGGHPLRARVYKFDPMLREVVASLTQGFFLNVAEGDPWLRMVKLGVYWLDVFLPEHRRRN